MNARIARILMIEVTTTVEMIVAMNNAVKDSMTDAIDTMIVVVVMNRHLMPVNLSSSLSQFIPVFVIRTLARVFCR